MEYEEDDSEKSSICRAQKRATNRDEQSKLAKNSYNTVSALLIPTVNSSANANFVQCRFSSYHLFCLPKLFSAIAYKIVWSDKHWLVGAAHSTRADAISP